MLITSRHGVSVHENKIMEIFAVIIVLLLTALLFILFGFPILQTSLGVSQSIVNNPTAVKFR